MSSEQLEGAQAARAAMMAADVIHQMSLRLSELEEALESCSGVQAAAEVTERCAEVLQGQLNDALRREQEARAENDAAASRLLQAQELCSRLFNEAERHQAAAVAAAARAAVADDRAAQAHRAADAAVESARAEAARQAAALEEERRLRTAAQAEAATLRGEKRHLEALMERLAAVVSTLTKRCAAFMDTGALPAAPPGGDRPPRRQQQGTVSQSQSSSDTPSSLASLTAVLRAAERELSALDERLGSPAVTADEQAQLRAAMQRTGARIRKIAAARASLLGVKS
jgi:hypothetical protein